ncbi:MAG: hypothetical protein Q8T03_05485 [Bacteroidota bacterium]|nr:hypothetical protein [Bacteroidota bacterium]
MDEILDKFLEFLRDEHKKGTIPVGNNIHFFCENNKIDYYGNLIDEYENVLIDKRIIKKLESGIWPDIEFHTFEGFTKSKLAYKNESELSIKVLELQKDELEYKKKIRGLEEQLLILNLIKEYWWFILLCIGLGTLIGKCLFQ